MLFVLYDKGKAIKELTYAGIGSRDTPDDVLKLMRGLGAWLGTLGYQLRSGAAKGADRAFEAGCDSVHGDKEIWLPWVGFNQHPEPAFYPTELHKAYGPSIHPRWEYLKDFEKALHARNVGQILGDDCMSPSKFIICWTIDGCESHSTRTATTRGTGSAISLASLNNIPIFNLRNNDCFTRLKYLVDSVLYYPSVYNDFYESDKRYNIPKDMVFVFGSNLAGRHGKGAALEARHKYGAEYGSGFGHYGQSFAIPTKGELLNILSLKQIAWYIDSFVKYTWRTDYSFFVTAVGCGLANYNSRDIAPMFKGARNCWFPDDWIPYIL